LFTLILWICILCKNSTDLLLCFYISLHYGWAESVFCQLLRGTSNDWIRMEI